MSFSYDAATIMFCSLYGFTELIDKMDPLKVRKMLWIEKDILCSSNVLNSSSFPFQSFKLLNDISLQLDMIISNFDVYKVECINTKYMVASGIPKENGK